MTKQLFKNLFLTFIFSLLLTGLLYAMWFSSKQRGFEEGQALTLLLLVGDLFHNLILTIAATPIFLLTKDNNFNNIQTRLLIYFAGPILLTLIFILFIANSSEDKVGFLIPGLSFLAIHAYFYTKLKQPKSDNIA